MSRTPGKYGRNVPRHTLGTVRRALIMHRALESLGTPPVISDDYRPAVHKQAPGGWGSMLNNSLGCCVCSDSGHEVMLVTANAGAIVIPSDQDILGMYEVVGGYVQGNPSTDQGCDEGQACQYLIDTGLAGLKSSGTGFVDPSRLDLVRWTVQIFGACRLGIMVTDDMEQAFSDGKPWEGFTGNIVGGHDVPIVYYDADYATVVTWGEEQRIAWSLLGNANFLQECHVSIWQQFVAATGTTPAGFNLAALTADLALVREA